MLLGRIRHHRRDVCDAQWSGRNFAAELRDGEERTGDKNAVDEDLKAAALFFFRTHDERVGGFECRRFNVRDCFHCFMTVRCGDSMIWIQDLLFRRALPRTASAANVS